MKGLLAIERGHYKKKPQPSKIQETRDHVVFSGNWYKHNIIPIPRVQKTSLRRDQRDFKSQMNQKSAVRQHLLEMINYTHKFSSSWLLK